MNGSEKKGKEAVNDDETAMRLLQQGSEDAFEQIVRRWEKPMLNFFYRSVGDVDAAEDLRQDLFVRLYTYRASYRGDGTFRAWLYQMAGNLVRTHLRRVKTFVPLDREATDDEDIVAETAADGGPPAGQVVQRHESERLVREMLATLSPEDREALILRFYEELPYGEICQTLGIAESGAKSRVYRAIERMRCLAAERGLTAGDLL